MTHSDKPSEEVGVLGFYLKVNERLGKEGASKGAEGMSSGVSLTWFLFSDLLLNLDSFLNFLNFSFLYL